MDSCNEETLRKNEGVEITNADKTSVASSAVHIVVLGDITRSPRMQYHALCFAQAGWRVHLSGYVAEPKCPKEKLLLPPLHSFKNSIEIFPLSEPPKWISSMKPAPLAYFFKLIFLTTALFFHLWWNSVKVPHLRWYLLQCPPAVPTFIVTWLVSCVRNSSVRYSQRWRRFISIFSGSVPSNVGVESGIAVDWHNYGFTLLQSSPAHQIPIIVNENANNQSEITAETSEIVDLHSSNMSRLPFVSRVYRALEIVFARQYLCDRNAVWNSDPSISAGDSHVLTNANPKYLHFTVSKAFQKDLHSHGIGPVNVLYDRPLNNEDYLSPLSLSQLYERRANFFSDSSLTPYLNELDSHYLSVDAPPFLLVSSCSWSVDDDFAPLLEALDMYVEERQRQLFNSTPFDGNDGKDSLPPILCIITGKGPLKAMYEKEMSQRKEIWKDHVAVVTPWLSAEDYPVLLSMADLGVCLHRSSSGLDLPMKIVDMFSSNLPVVALRYSCINELVSENWNGHVFSESHKLYDLLISIISHHQQSCISMNSSQSQLHCSCELSQFRHNIFEWGKSNDWQTIWKTTVLPHVSSAAICS